MSRKVNLDDNSCLKSSQVPGTNLLPCKSVFLFPLVSAALRQHPRSVLVHRTWFMRTLTAGRSAESKCPQSAQPRMGPLYCILMHRILACSLESTVEETSEGLKSYRSGASMVKLCLNKPATLMSSQSCGCLHGTCVQSKPFHVGRGGAWDSC